MTHPVVEIRKIMASLIEAERSNFVDDGFELDQGSIPARKRIDELKGATRVALLGLGWDDSALTRSRSSQVDVTVQVTIQRKLARKSDGSEDQEMADDLVIFMSQVGDVAKGAQYNGFGWLRNEPLRDATGTPYSFELYREEGLFQGIFNSIYRGPWVPFNRSGG